MEKGTQFGRFQIVRLIASGGTADIYEATDPGLSRRVALKVLRTDEGGENLILRLRREATAAAKLRHPNIVQVYEVGSAVESGEARHFIAMEFVDGVPLSESLPWMGLRERVQVLEVVARAAAYAQGHGIVHRDLKPQNVLVEHSTRRICLTDFGLAKIVDGEDFTRTGAVFGTPKYMAPEQVRGEIDSIGPPTDVWALGVMLYEVLTDRAPFEGETLLEVYNRVVGDDPSTIRSTRRELPVDLKTICLKALQKDPQRRYPEASEFAEDLRRWLANEPIAARPISTLEQFARSVRRHRGVVMALGVVLVAGLAGTGLWVRRESRERRVRAEELDRSARREASLRRLQVLWATILDRKRDLRGLRSPPERARLELQQAVDAVGALLSDRPDAPQGYYVRARGRLYLGDFAGAEQDLRTALGMRPDFRPGWSLLGALKVEKYVSFQWGASNTSRERAEKYRWLLAEADDAFGRGWEEGREREESEHWGLPWTREDQVMNRLTRALRLYYSKTQEEQARRLLLEGVKEFSAEEYAYWLGIWSDSHNEALSWQSRAVEWAPGYELPLVERGFLRHTKGDFAGAVSDLDAAIRIRGSFAAAHVNRGLSKGKLGDSAGALADFERALELGADAPAVLLNRSAIRSWAGDPQGALRDLDRAIELRSDFMEAFLARARIKRKWGDPQGALRDCSRAIEIDDAGMEAFQERAALRRELGDREGAIADYGRMIQLAPDSRQAFVGRADVRQELRDYTGAILDYDRAIELGDLNHSTFCNRGRAKTLSGDDKGALTDYARAIEIKADYPAAHFNRAISRRNLGDRAGALADFDRVIELRPDNADARMYRGELKMELRNFSAAIGDLEEALRTAPPGWRLQSRASALLKEARLREDRR